MPAICSRRARRFLLTPDEANAIIDEVETCREKRLVPDAQGAGRLRAGCRDAQGSVRLSGVPARGRSAGRGHPARSAPFAPQQPQARAAPDVSINFALINAVKELKAANDNLRAANDNQDAAIERLRAENHALKETQIELQEMNASLIKRLDVLAAHVMH